MPTRNVVLTDYQSRMIDTLVESGRYQNASEVLREGLRLIEAREALETAKLEALRAAAVEGAAAFERADFNEFSEPHELAGHLEKIAETAIARRKVK